MWWWGERRLTGIIMIHVHVVTQFVWGGGAHGGHRSPSVLGDSDSTGPTCGPQEGYANGGTVQVNVTAEKGKGTGIYYNECLCFELFGMRSSPKNWVHTEQRAWLYTSDWSKQLGQQIDSQHVTHRKCIYASEKSMARVATEFRPNLSAWTTRSCHFE